MEWIATLISVALWAGVYIWVAVGVAVWIFALPQKQIVDLSLLPVCVVAWPLVLAIWWSVARRAKRARRRAAQPPRMVVIQGGKSRRAG